MWFLLELTNIKHLGRYLQIMIFQLNLSSWSQDIKVHFLGALSFFFINSFGCKVQCNLNWRFFHVSLFFRPIAKKEKVEHILWLYSQTRVVVIFKIAVFWQNQSVKGKMVSTLNLKIPFILRAGYCERKLHYSTSRSLKTCFSLSIVKKKI